MKFTSLMIIFVVMLTAGILLKGLSFVFISGHHVNAQIMGNGGMMGSGLMGNGGMMGSGLMGNGGMMGSGVNNPNITNMTLSTKATAGITVSIVSDAAVMGDKAFQPNPLIIKAGGSVRWINDDTLMHTVTSGFGPNDPNEGKQFNSGLVAEGQAVTHTFNKVGEFNYFCQVHPNMVGKVRVE